MSYATLATALGTSNVFKASVRLPAWGVWSARASVDTPKLVTGPVVLTLGPLVLSGTIRRGETYVGKAEYRIFGGADGWGSTIPADSFRNPGTLLSTLIEASAKACGEKVDLTLSSDAEIVIGKYQRSEGPASRVLDTYLPEKWWVDIDGTTRVGDRAPLPSIGMRVLDFDAARGIVTTSDEESILLPGQVFESGGIAGEISTVFYDLDGGKLRSEAYFQ